MAVFKAPRINSTQRASLVLEPSEIVYDTDLNLFYGGNGQDIGGFPIGAGSGSITEVITLDQNDLINKYVTLNSSPYFSNKVSVTPSGGIPQINGVDFEVVGNELSWNGLGLDNFLELGEQLIIQY